MKKRGGLGGLGARGSNGITSIAFSGTGTLTSLSVSLGTARSGRANLVPGWFWGSQRRLERNPVPNPVQTPSPGVLQSGQALGPRCFPF